MACGAERLAGGHGCPSVERIGPASMTLLAIGLSSTSSQRLSDSPRCPHISGETPGRPWIDNFEKRLDRMIEEIKKKFPGGCQIFLANIYDPSDGSGDTTICFF